MQLIPTSTGQNLLSIKRSGKPSLNRRQPVTQTEDRLWDPPLNPILEMTKPQRCSQTMDQWQHTKMALAQKSARQPWGSWQCTHPADTGPIPNRLHHLKDNSQTREPSKGQCLDLSRPTHSNHLPLIFWPEPPPRDPAQYPREFKRSILRKRETDEIQELIYSNHWVTRPAEERYPGFTELSIDDMGLNQDLVGLGHLILNNQKREGGTKSGLSQAYGPEDKSSRNQQAQRCRPESRRTTTTTKCLTKS